MHEIQNRLSEVSLEDTKNRLRQLSEELDGFDNRAAKLYEDRLSGAITLDTFMLLSASHEDEKVEAQSEYNRLSSACQTAEQQVLDIGRWMSCIRSYMAMESPDRDVLNALIERIEIGEGIGRGKSRQQAVKIIYRFIGHME